MTSHPSYPPVSALRERMIEDMTVRGIGAKTRHDYVRHVRTFAAFIGRSPDTTTPEEVRRFQLHQTETGVGAPSINSAVSALRFLFSVTLERPDLARRLTVVREARKLPLVLSAQEVALLLEAAPGPKYKAALATAYGAGLRVAEVVALKIGDVDSTRMMLRVEQGKGRRDRYAMLSPQLLALLRAWWREGRRRGHYGAARSGQGRGPREPRCRSPAARCEESGMTRGVETRLDGSTLVVRIPVRFQRRGGRKRILALDGSGLAPSSGPQPDGTLVKALARAWRWQRMLDDASTRQSARLATPKTSLSAM
jgi:integrase